MADAPATDSLFDFIEKRNYPTIGNSLTPYLFESITQQRATQTIVHKIINRAAPEISVGVTELRTGTMTLLFKDRASQDFAAYLSGGFVYTLRSYSNTKLDRMNFVISSPVTYELDEATRVAWHVTFDYVEVG